MHDSGFLGVAQNLRNRFLDLRIRYGLSEAARAESKRELRTGARQDVPIDDAVTEALAWIARAQDNSTSADGGVARHYCLISGWGPSYPETTGYIVPTVIREARARRCQIVGSRPEDAGLAGQHPDVEWRRFGAAPSANLPWCRSRSIPARSCLAWPQESAEFGSRLPPPPCWRRRTGW